MTGESGQVGSGGYHRPDYCDLVCDGCGSTSSDVRLVDVEDPDGRVTTCDTCEPQLRSDIVREIDSNSITEGSA